MLCDKCKKNEAKITIKEIGQDHKIVVLHLCEQCAEKKGVLIKAANSPLEILHQILGKPKKVDLICPHCKMTFEQFQQEARFGCSKCYDAFRPEITKIIAKIQGAQSHTGRKPKEGFKPQNLRIEMMRLREELRTALEKEEYEKAAEIRDQLKKMVENE